MKRGILFESKKTGLSPKKAVLDPKKSKILSFPAIKDALAQRPYGTVFSTPESDRIYVITKGTWGEKSNDKVVKGFPATTPLSEIENYSKRTQTKHGSAHLQKTKGYEEKGMEQRGYATKSKKDPVKNFKPLF